MAALALLRCGLPDPADSVNREIPERRTAERLFTLTGSDEDFKVGIHLLRSADVKADVDKALHADDCRLIALLGVTTYVPAFDDGMPPPGFAFVRVEGTSDFIETELQGEFQELLLKYAEAYNQGLVAACSSRRGGAP
jgi:hypothetical protein